MINQAVQATGHSRHLQHKLPQAQTKSTSQQQTALESETSCSSADGDSGDAAQVDYTDQASSRTDDTGRASKGKASARRRLADGRSEYEGGWSRDIWN